MLHKLLKSKGSKGFTLIELIVVIAILAVLAVLIVPRFAGFTVQAQYNSVLADAKTIQKAIATVYADKGHYPDALEIIPYIGGAKGATDYTVDLKGGDAANPGTLVLTSGGNPVAATGAFTFTKTVKGTAYTAVATTTDGAISVTPVP